MLKRTHSLNENSKVDLLNPLYFTYSRKKLTTTELRRQIRIELARQKSGVKNDITHARQSDSALFHRIVRKQRGHFHKCIDELFVGEKHYSEDSLLSGFYEHFRDLA